MITDAVQRERMLRKLEAQKQTADKLSAKHDPGQHPEARVRDKPKLYEDLFAEAEKK